MTQFETVEAWAKALGSKARTRKGQRRAILASFDRSHGLARIDRNLYAAQDYRDRQAATVRQVRGEYAKSLYIKSRLSERQYRSPAAIAERARIYEQNRRATFLTGGFGRGSLESLAPNFGYIVLGGWHVRVIDETAYDWDYYAKSYRHPRKTVTARTVCIRRIASNGSFESRDKAVTSFRGNYLLDAIAGSGICGYREGPLHVRLHDVYNAQLVRKGRSVSIYERTLAGTQIDYCAASGSTTYHASTQKSAIAGLRSKLRVKARGRGGIIDLKLCKDLGFCDAGLEAFAKAFDLDIRGQYTPEQIAERIAKNPPAAAPFANELNTLAKAVNYRIPVALQV